MIDLFLWTLASFYYSVFNAIGSAITFHLLSSQRTAFCTMYSNDCKALTSCLKQRINRKCWLWASVAKCHICTYIFFRSVKAECKNCCTVNPSPQLSSESLMTWWRCCSAVPAEPIKAVFFYSCMILLECRSVLHINFCFPLLLY